MYYIQPQLLFDRTSSDRPNDAFYVECAYRYLFGLSERITVLAGDGAYITSASDLEGGVRRIVRAARPMSLRIGLLVSTVDYNVFLSNTQGRSMQKSRPCPYLSGLG